MEKEDRKEYVNSMVSFSKKRFLITLGLSILVWVVSMVIQQVVKGDNVNYGFFIFAKSCEVTGYPFARCIPDYDKGQIYFTYLINLLSWFFIIHLFWGWVDKSKNKS